MYACMRTLYNIADTLRRVPLLCAASHIIGNYNYLCSVPLRCALIVWRDAYSGQQAPPLQTKTLKTKRVFLWVLRFCSM